MRWRWRRGGLPSSEFARLLQPRPRFTVHFSASQVAASLWDFGEDALAAKAVQMSDSDLLSIRSIAAWYEDPDYPLPVHSQRITHNHVTALAAVTWFEGGLRPLARERRRPTKARPPEFEPQPPEFTS